MNRLLLWVSYCFFALDFVWWLLLLEGHVIWSGFLFTGPIDQRDRSDAYIVDPSNLWNQSSRKPFAIDQTQLTINCARVGRGGPCRGLAGPSHTAGSFGPISSIRAQPNGEGPRERTKPTSLRIFSTQSSQHLEQNWDCTGYKTWPWKTTLPPTLSSQLFIYPYYFPYVTRQVLFLPFRIRRL